MEFILKQVESKIVFVENEKKLDLILSVDSMVETIVILRPPETLLENDKGIKAEFIKAMTIRLSAVRFISIFFYMPESRNYTNN